jgi:hypothetical protein
MSEPAWGTPVMMLGNTPRAMARGGTGALGAVSEAPVNWAYLLGSYAGAWAGGAAVGYLVGRDTKAALTGGMAASGIWGVGDTLAYARARPPLLTALFAAAGAGSLAIAWYRR